VWGERMREDEMLNMGGGKREDERAKVGKSEEQ